MKGEKLLGYDPSKGGALAGPFYTKAFHETSLCVQLLIEEHEQDHLDDNRLQGACNQLMKTWHAAKRPTKQTRRAYEQARESYEEARRKSECHAYGRDAECLEKLRECCARLGTRKTRKNGNEIYCCLCKDVEEAATEVEKGLKRNKCKQPEGE